MADLKPFLIMSKTQAARFREETATDENRLDPRAITIGPFKDKYALPERVIYDDNFEDRRDALRMLEVVALDVAATWPPEVEE